MAINRLLATPESVVVPPSLRGLPIQALRLTRKVENALRARRIRTTDDLHHVRNLSAIRGLGPVGRAEIHRAVAEMTGAPPPPTDLREDIENVPIEALGLPLRVENALRAGGITLCGELAGLGPGLFQLPNVGRKAREQIRQGLELLGPAAARIREQLGAGGVAPIPSAPVVMQELLSRATSVTDEVNALLFGLGDRNVVILKERWTSRRGRQSTLDVIAARFGVTRERIRQIVSKREDTLRASGLVLPVSSALVRLLNEHGGALSTGKFLRLARRVGYEMDESDLGVVACISELGLAGEVLCYNRDYDVWITTSGQARWLESGDLRSTFREVRREVTRELRRIGAFRVKLLMRAAPLGSRRILRSLRSRGVLVTRVNDYLVAATTESTLRRVALKALVVAETLTLVQLNSALSGVRRVHLPPIAVLKEILARCPELTVREEIVSLAMPLRLEDALSPSEVACVRAFESAGGVMLWHEFIDAMLAAGFSLPMAAVLQKSAPFIARRGIGIYTLRRGEMNKALFRVKVREREESQTEAVRRVREVSPDVIEVQYVVTRFSQYGTLSMVPALCRIGMPRWRLRLPDGRVRDLKYGNGFIWTFGPWFREAGIKAGDKVTMTFYISSATVEVSDVVMNNNE